MFWNFLRPLRGDRSAAKKEEPVKNEEVKNNDVTYENRKVEESVRYKGASIYTNLAERKRKRKIQRAARKVSKGNKYARSMLRRLQKKVA